MASAAPSGDGGGDEKRLESVLTIPDPPSDPLRNGEPPASPPAPIQPSCDYSMSAMEDPARAGCGTKRPPPSRAAPCRACERRKMILRGIDPGPRSDDEFPATTWCRACDFRRKLHLSMSLRRNSGVPAPPPGSLVPTLHLDDMPRHVLEGNPRLQRGEKRPLSVEQERGYRECDLGKKVMRHRWDGLHHKWAVPRWDSAPGMAGSGAMAGQRDVLEKMMLVVQKALRADDAKLALLREAQKPGSSAAARVDVLQEKLAQMVKVVQVSMKLTQLLCPDVGFTTLSGGGLDGSDWGLVEEAIDDLLNHTGKAMQDIVKKVIPKVFSKDILYDLIMACVGRYPKLLEDDKGELTEQQYKQYEKQLDLMVNLSMVYDNDPENFSKIMKLMCNIGSCGPIPSAVIANISPGLDPSTMEQLYPTRGLKTGGLKRKRDMEDAGHAEEQEATRDESLDSTFKDQLPDDILVSILMMIQRKYDRRQMALCNRACLEAYTRDGFQFPHELPWLLIPSTIRPLLHVTAEGTTYCHSLREGITSDARFCGSAEGGRAVLSLEHSRQHMLYNLENKRTNPLPRTIEFTNGEVQQVRVVAAVPYGWPDANSVCVVAAVVRPVTANGKVASVMAYWQPGRAHWVHARSAWSRNERRLDILDVLYHSDRQAFLFLSEDLSLHAFKLVFGTNGEFMIAYEHLHNGRAWHDFKMVDCEVVSRLQYLVQSGHNILRIVRTLWNEDSNHTGTKRFTIYQLEEVDDEEEDEVYWSLAGPLPGRAIFVGRASSRVCERTDSFGGHLFFHEELTTQIPVTGQFDRTDTGKFCLQTKVMLAWPPTCGASIPPVSDICPSVWWFH